jgi:NAD+ synthase
MQPPLRLAIAQLNPVVGDIAGNLAKIAAAHDAASVQGANLVICPELSLVGYPPEDLVLSPSFRARAMEAVTTLAEKTVNGVAIVVGSVVEENGKIFNAVLLLDGGKIIHVQHKVMLPNYGIFDEKRIFSTGEAPKVFSWRGMTLGMLVCEDVWNPELPESLKRNGAELLIVVNASPFEAGKMAQRKEVVRGVGVPLVYANMVGGQDDIVFDGGSFVMAADGKVVMQMAEFEEGLAVFAYPVDPALALRAPQDDEWRLWQAMVVGLRDYVNKNGFPGVMLGLSGGIDSAISAAVAVDALGADRVKGVLLPSPYTSKESVEDALHTATLLGIETMSVPIAPGMAVFDEVLSPVFRESGWMENVAIGGNVQARLRGMTLMAISNRYGWMVMSTGNKSEIAVGYSTLYGDSCGGYNVLKDLYKTQVYALANWRNRAGVVIPERSISKAPSAELAPGQKDEDQLPPYAVLDRILFLHVENRLGVEEIVAQGFAQGMVEKIVRLVRISEYKRRQSCPGVKLSGMLFGKDRRFPMTNKF